MQIEKIVHPKLVTKGDPTKFFQTRKDNEDKNDPMRRNDVWPPLEALTIQLTGKPPHDYFEPGDPIPWWLLVIDSRYGTAYQVMSGCLDMSADLRKPYFQLARDFSLNDDEYARELQKLNEHFFHVLDHRHDHHHVHHKMQSRAGHVDCTACSVLAILAVEDPTENSIYDSLEGELDGLSYKEREEFLLVHGLQEYLYATTDDVLKKKIVLSPNIY